MNIKLILRQENGIEIIKDMEQEHDIKYVPRIRNNFKQRYNIQTYYNHASYYGTNHILRNYSQIHENISLSVYESLHEIKSVYSYNNGSSGRASLYSW